MRLHLHTMIPLLCTSSNLVRASRWHRQSTFGAVAAFSSPNASSGQTEKVSSGDESEGPNYSPWNNPHMEERFERKKVFRARQHVNPLANKFQQPTVLTPDWPKDVYDDLSRPFFLDIGCSRGGFLVDFASQHPDEYNYLGLEIRPIVVHHAQTRVKKHSLEGHLSFVGCNANVDLERLLTLADAKDKLTMVTIQFPDPHFKARHAKRRVVTAELVMTLARFMPPSTTVFLQSDIQAVLDEMRSQFRQEPLLFEDTVENDEEYLEDNIFGMPTEREVSVLEKGLPVYRTTFTRTENPAVDGPEP